MRVPVHTTSVGEIFIHASLLKCQCVRQSAARPILGAQKMERGWTESFCGLSGFEYQRPVYKTQIQNIDTYSVKSWQLLSPQATTKL